MIILALAAAVVNAGNGGGQGGGWGSASETYTTLTTFVTTTVCPVTSTAVVGGKFHSLTFSSSPGQNINMFKEPQKSSLLPLHQSLQSLLA